MDLLTHELGHRYWYKFLNESQRARFESWILVKGEENSGKTVAPVSGYGSNNISEAWAEVFSYYVTGKDMNRDQIDSFKAILKRGSELPPVEPHIIERRQAALTHRVVARHEYRQAIRVADYYLDQISEPGFNWREITKQMLLLEDHLFVPVKNCPDCIKKHLLNLEGLAEEIPSLAGSDPNKGMLGSLDPTKFAGQCRVWMARLLDGEDLWAVGSEIRALRKNMVEAVADPRGKTAAAKRPPIKLYTNYAGDGRPG